MRANQHPNQQDVYYLEKITYAINFMGRGKTGRDEEEKKNGIKLIIS